MIQIALSFPPSTNNLFPSFGKRRGVSKEYEAWREENGWEIQRQKPGRIQGRVRIEIQLENGRRTDASNCIKAIEDLLVTHGVIEGDGPKHVRDVRARYDETVTGAVVSIYPL